MLISWMTSLPGVILVALGIIGLKWACIDTVTGIAIITAGLGLIGAKQFNVTGGSVPQASPPGAAAVSNVMGADLPRVELPQK